MASADFPEPLGPGISLGQCRPCPFTPSGSTVTVDDSRASLMLACSPAAPGLTASSCSYGRRFASGPFAPVPYGSNLTFSYGCRHLPVGDLSPREVRHLPGTRAPACCRPEVRASGPVAFPRLAAASWSTVPAHRCRAGLAEEAHSHHSVRDEAANDARAVVGGCAGDNVAPGKRRGPLRQPRR